MSTTTNNNIVINNSDSEDEKSQQIPQVYCVKCKSHTDNLEVIIEPQTTYRLKCKCAVCLKKKNKSVKLSA